MDAIEKWGVSVDEAVDLALQEMKLTREDVDVIVLEEPSRGFFGIGTKLAKMSQRKKLRQEKKARSARKRSSRRSWSQRKTGRAGSQKNARIEIAETEITKIIKRKRIKKKRKKEKNPSISHWTEWTKTA